MNPVLTIAAIWLAIDVVLVVVLWLNGPKRPT